jgi:hypothetical protein
VTPVFFAHFCLLSAHVSSTMYPGVGINADYASHSDN